MNPFNKYKYFMPAAAIHAKKMIEAIGPLMTIEEKYNSPGMAELLGMPTSGELQCKDRKGKYQNFRNGAIYWYPSFGAHAVYGNIYEKWKNHNCEISRLGYPISDIINDNLFDLWKHCNFQHGIMWDDYYGVYDVYYREEPSVENTQIGFHFGLYEGSCRDFVNVFLRIHVWPVHLYPNGKGKKEAFELEIASQNQFNPERYINVNFKLENLCRGIWWISISDSRFVLAGCPLEITNNKNLYYITQGYEDASTEYFPEEVERWRR